MINEDMHRPVYTPQEMVMYLEVIVQRLKNVDISRKDIIESIRANQNRIADIYSG